MENMTTEKQAYIKKLGQQITAMGRILGMDSGSVLSGEAKARLQNLKEEAERLKRKLETNEFEIAIVGLEKAGKSTFANALMQKSNLLPTDDQRCTFTSTLITYDGRGESASVSFYSSEKFNRDFRDKLSKLDIKNAERYSYDTLDLSLFRQMCEKEISSDRRKLYGDMIDDIENVIQYRDEISALLNKPDKAFDASRMEELRPFITDVKKAYAVSMVRICSPALQHMPNAVIYDVPGFNSPTELHKIQTRERMESADAIIVVASGKEPSITGESLKILQESDGEGNRLSDKLFVFANKTDGATDIRKNMDVTFHEWIEKWQFLSEARKKRIVFGSALLYLERLDNREGIATRSLGNRFDELPDGDGVDEIRRRMEDYNRHERFDVLKRRINRLQSEITGVFSQMHAAYGETDIPGYSEEHMRLATELTARAPSAAKRDLKTIRQEMIERFNRDKPLSERIFSYIDDNITAEKYLIENDEIEIARKDSLLTDVAPEIRKIDEKIREARFNRMYDDFSENVISLASAYHQEYTEHILNALLSAMEVSDSSPFYEELKSQLAAELAPWRGSERTDDQYQSLIEQFSRDLYETLIYCPYTEERLRKFYENADRFFALSVFYRAPDAKDELAYIRIAPEKQPLCKMLLFHEYRNLSEKLNRLVGVVSKKVKLPPGIEAELNRALYALEGDVERGEEILDKKFSKAADKSDEFKLNLLRSAIEEICAMSGPTPSIADKEAFISYYKGYHNSLRKGLITQEEMKEDFQADVEILRDVLLNAFVSAISMDRPFIKRESKSIEDIMDYADSEKFREFLRLNFRKIKYAETERLDRAERERRQNQDIAREVDSILKTLETA